MENDDVAIDFYSLFRIYKDGRVQRFAGTEIVPPCPDPEKDDMVRSKDVVISPETGLSARLFLPKTVAADSKLPLLVFFHGGAFCIGTPFSPMYHNHVASLSAAANIVALSVHYRRAPEHPLPTAFHDAWEAFRWAMDHGGGGGGHEEWLNRHADFRRVLLAGDSAGATIAHNVAVRAGSGEEPGTKIEGMVLFHPFFGSEERDRLLEIIFPTSGGAGRDPRLNPAADLKLLGRLPCGHVLIFVAEKDRLKERGRSYFQALKKSGWTGNAEIVETQGEKHVFHLLNPSTPNALALMDDAVSFFKRCAS